VFDISPVHLILFAAIALIVVGPRRLPEMARNLGRGVREFKSAIALDDDTRTPQTPAQPEVTTPTTIETAPAADISAMVRPGDDQPERPTPEQSGT
jgi:sec-independent protein translocase protein TatA